MDSLEHTKNLLLEADIKCIGVSITFKDGKKTVKPNISWSKVNNLDKCLKSFEKKYNGIAILTGKINNLTVIDIDDMESFEKLGITFDETLVCYTKKGKHIYCNYTSKLSTTTNYIDGVDIRNDKAIIITDSSFYKTEDDVFTYKFNVEIEEAIKIMKELPEVPDEFYKIKPEKVLKYIKVDISKRKMRRIIYKIKEILTDIPISAVDNHENWLKIGFAIANVCNQSEEGLEVFKAYYSQGEKYNEKECDELYYKENKEIFGIEYIEALRRQHMTINMEDDIFDKDTIIKLAKNNDFSSIRRYCNRFFCYIDSPYDGKPYYIQFEYNNDKVIRHIFIKNELLLTSKIASSVTFEIGDKYLPILKIWTSWEGRRQYSDTIFKPNVYERRKLNLFTGFAHEYEEEFEVDETKIEHIMKHLKEVICNDDEQIFNYLLMWFANIVQNPCNRPGIAILCKSVEGAGKNIFFDRFAEHVIGLKYSLSISDPSQIVGQFTGLIDQKMFTIVNELRAEGNIYTKSDRMKTLITDPTQKIEKKGYDAQIEQNYNNFVFLTNNTNVINITSDDRRYVCLEVSKRYKGNQRYFNELIDNFKKENGKHFYHYLMRIKIGNLKNIPMTAYKRALIEHSLPSHIKFIGTWLESKGVDFENPPDEEDEISINQLYSEYKEYCMVNNINNKLQKRFERELFDVDMGINPQYRVKSKRKMMFRFNFKELVDDLRDKKLLF